MQRSDFAWEADEVHDELWLQIREVLMRYWDPIGVSEIPEAADEYDFYIPAMRKLVIRHATISDLVDHLDTIATERMGFTSQPEKSATAAEFLSKLRSQ